MQILMNKNVYHYFNLLARVHTTSYQDSYSVGGYYVRVGHTYLHAWMVQVAYSVVVE